MRRSYESEIMDDPALDETEHCHARQGLARINNFIGSARLLWTQIKPLAQAQHPQALRVLDVATGTAHVCLQMWQLAAREGYRLQVDGCDFSDSALNEARRQAEALKSSSKFFALNVVRDSLPDDYDVVMTSLFLHHLSEDDTRSLLINMRQAARQMVIAVDLTRSPVNHTFVWLAAHLFSSSRVVHFDGPASVRKSYTIEELRDMACQAGFTDFSLEAVFPTRMMMVWKKRR